jgi:hypothetical protein
MVECGKCHEVVDAWANGKSCRRCYNAYMNAYMTRRYHERRALAIERLGGSCVQCGSTDRLEMDHIDPARKLINVSNQTWTSEAYWLEMRKIQLLCRPHHQQKTARQLSVPHGGGITGRRNCRCELCRPLKNAYNRQRKQGPLAQLVELRDF